MVVLGYFLQAVTTVLRLLIDVSIMLLFLRALLSWMGPSFGSFGTFIFQATEPFLRKVRQKIPPIGMFDLSVFILLLVLVFLRQFLIDTMEYYTGILLSGVEI